MQESALRELALPRTKEANVDPMLARVFIRAIARLTADSETWKLLPFCLPGRPYQIPIRDNVALLVHRSPDLSKEFVIGVKALVRAQVIRQVFIYDTRLSDRVHALCRTLEPQLDRLVIRDHHAGPMETARAQDLKRIYGSRAEIVVCPRSERPTCFEMLSGHDGELRKTPTPTLVITAPLDIDSLNCVARGLGFSYAGQGNDVLAIEAKDRLAKKIGVSVLGDLILDALRVSPMVVLGRGSETFSTLLQIAALQAIEHSEAHGRHQETAAGEALLLLKNLGSMVKSSFVEALFVEHLEVGRVVASGECVNLSLVDLTSEAALKAAPRAEKTELSFSRLQVHLHVTASQISKELFNAPDRLRMSTLEDTCAGLIKSGRLPRDCLVVVRYPTENEGSSILRVVAFGGYRFSEFTRTLPWQMSPSGHGIIEDEAVFRAWILGPSTSAT